jgi:hypothetical protein
MTDGKFSSISRRKFDETAIGAATDSEESLVRLAVRAPVPSCYYFHIDLKKEKKKNILLSLLKFSEKSHVKRFC